MKRSTPYLAILTATVAGIAIISVHYHYLLTHSF